MQDEEKVVMIFKSSEENQEMEAHVEKETPTSGQET
jgi:hypothetical protein